MGFHCFSNYIRFFNTKRFVALPSFADCPVSDLWLIYSFFSDTQGLQKDCLANFNPLVPNSEKVMKDHISPTSWCFTAICFYNYVICYIIPLPLHVSHFSVILANFVPIIIRKYVIAFVHASTTAVIDCIPRLI